MTKKNQAIFCSNMVSYLDDFKTKNFTKDKLNFQSLFSGTLQLTHAFQKHARFLKSSFN